jgi:transcriptional regulator with XRE-family HTH domain
LHNVEHLRTCFAKVIIRRRLRKKWSQTELAGYTGLERSYISRLERGERTPSLDVILRFAEAFKVSPLTIVQDILKEMADYK